MLFGLRFSIPAQSTLSYDQLSRVERRQNKTQKAFIAFAVWQPTSDMRNRWPSRMTERQVIPTPDIRRVQPGCRSRGTTRGGPQTAR